MAFHNNHGNHSNHKNGTHNNTTQVDPNTGAPQTLTWSEWATDQLDDVKINESVSKLNELRDKISYLQQNKSGPTAEVLDNGVYIPDNPALDWTGAQSTDFDDSDPQTAEYVDVVQYDTIRTNLETLFSHIEGATTIAPDRAEGDVVRADDWEAIKQKVDQLAQADNSTEYANHHNHVNHYNYSN